MEISEQEIADGSTKSGQFRAILGVSDPCAPVASHAETHRSSAICSPVSGALAAPARESCKKMNQQKRPTSTSIPSDLAVFRGPDEPIPTLT
jgi:hypothetical protein